MGVPRICATVAVISLAALCLNDCTEKKYINQPLTDAVHIHGIVYGWRCGIGDPWNNPYDSASRRFSAVAEEPATISFIRDNGFTSSVETDTASEYDIYLSAGSHKIAVETGYTFPPDTTYNIQLRPGDTTIDLNIAYDVLDPLNINCVFGYLSIDDTAGFRAEWDVVWELNRRGFGPKGPYPVFDIGWGNPPPNSRILHTSEYTPRVYVYYKLPVLRAYPGVKIYNVFEAYGVLQGILDTDTTGFFPSNFSLYPAGVYICLAGQ